MQAALTSEARRLAGAPETAQVLFYTAEDCFDGTALSVPAPQFRAIREHAPLVLAKLQRGAGSAPVLVAVQPLTRAFCDSPAGRAAAAFVASRNEYEVLVARLPQYVPTAGTLAPPGAAACRCGGAALRRWALVTPARVASALATIHDMPLDALVTALLVRAHEVLDTLEQRVLAAGHRADAVQTMGALRALDAAHYDELWNGMGGAATRATAAAALLVLAARPRAEAAPRPRDAPRRAFDEEATSSNNAYCPWSTALFAAEDMRVQHLLGDHELGAHRCAACVDAVLASVQEALRAHAQGAAHEVPWIASVFGAPPAQWAARVPGTDLYTVQRALAWRLPSMVEYRENAADAQPLLDLAALLYGAVPLVARRLHLEALRHAFEAYTSDATPPRALQRIAELQLHPDVAALCAAWDKSAAAAETSLPALAACRAATPCPPALAALRAARPVQIASAARERAGDGASQEEARAWHDALGKRRAEIAQRVGDIEDLLSNGALPPCLDCALTATRTAAHADHVERRTLALWTRDMGAPPSAAAALVLGPNAEAARVREMESQAEYSARQTTTTSLGCKAIINPSAKNGDYGAAIRCPVRAEHLGANDTGGAITDNDVIGAIRWRCTKKLRGFVEGAHPRFAVWHPLDFVTLQLDAA